MSPSDDQLQMINVMDHIETEVEYSVNACGCKKEKESKLLQKGTGPNTGFLECKGKKCNLMVAFD